MKIFFNYQRSLFPVILLWIFTTTSCGAQQKKETPDEIKNLKMNEEKMKIEVWSDVICPFCYIGKRHYEAALKQFADSSKVELVWKSFQLDPDMPKDNGGRNAYQYLADRKGITYEQSVAMHRNVIEMAKSCGLTYNYDKAVVANSFDAHRLLQFAKTKGLGDAMKELLFKSYFTEGKNIADKTILKALALSCGLPQQETEAVLNSTLYSEEVKNDIQEAEKIGVTGVPFFVFNRKYAVSGAQPVEAFLQTLKKSYAEWQMKNPSENLKVNEGKVCTPEKDCK